MFQNKKEKTVCVDEAKYLADMTELNFLKKAEIEREEEEKDELERFRKQDPKYKGC